MKRLILALLCALCVFPVDAQQGGGFPPAGTPKPIIFVGTGGMSLAGIKVGQTAYLYFTGGSTTRTSNVTLANDPNLLMTSIPNGAYRFKAEVSWSVATTTTQSFDYFWSSTTGTAATALGGACYGGSAISATLGFWNGLPNGGTVPSATISGAGAAQNLVCQGSITCASGPCTLSLTWAQGSSSANGTTVSGGSFMEMTRVQ